jgi:hypothetical protein
MKLEKEEQKYPISETDYKKLNKKCSEILTNSNSFSELTSAMICKLLLFTGVKASKISNFILTDINNNKIRIDPYWIDMPNNFKSSIERYLHERNKLLTSLNLQDTNQLFIYSDGQPFKPKDYFNMFQVIYDTIGHRKSECIAQYAILQMITIDINPIIIAKFTGHSLKTCEFCQEIIIDRLGGAEFTNKYINSKLMSSKKLCNL